MVGNNISKKRYIFLALLGFISIFILWSLLTYTGLVKSLFLPTPTAVFNNFFELLLHQNLSQDIFISFYRIVIGFLLAVLLAVPLGIAIGVSRNLEALIEPVVALARYMPAAAFIPLAILWLGIGDIEKMFIIFIGIFPYLTLLVADIVLHVDINLINSAKTYGASKKIILKEVIIPASLPGIWDSLRVMAGIGWTYIIVAELVAARSGLGHMIIEAQRYLLTANIIVGLLVIGLLGLGIDFIFKYFYVKLFPYTIKGERR